MRYHRHRRPRRVPRERLQLERRRATARAAARRRCARRYDPHEQHRRRAVHHRTRRDRQPRPQRRRDLDPRRRRAARRVGLRDPDPRTDPQPRRSVDHRALAPARACATPALERFGLHPSTYDGVDGLAARTDLGGLNLSRVPKVFVEVANMQNHADEAPMERPAFRQGVARALLAGLERFLSSR